MGLFLVVFGCIFWSLEAGVASKKERYSTLSDGSFETQLPLPANEAIPPGSPEMMKALKHYEGLPFDVGERIQYLVTYLGIKGGTAEVTVRHPVKWGNSWAQRVTAEVKSASWYRWVVEIHDALEAVFLPLKAFQPARFYINQLEGSFRQTKLIHFDSQTKEVIQKEKRPDRDLKEKRFPLTDRAKDAIGALYHFRTEVNARQGKDRSFGFDVFTSEKIWAAKAKLLRTEVKKVEGFSYDTDVYALDTQFGGLLQQEGDVRIWLTRDNRRLPVYVQANVQFGYIEVNLVEWDQGFANPKAKEIFPKIRAKED